MGEVLPLKGIFSGSTVTGLGEFRTATADVIGVAHGGTGLATIAANRIVTGNGTSAVTADVPLPVTILFAPIVASPVPP